MKVDKYMSAELGAKIVTKFAIVSMKNMIRVMTRIVHLNLRNPLSMFTARATH